MTSRGRTIAVGALAVVFVIMSSSLARNADAAPPSAACGEAYVQGQQLRNKGKLVKAREQFLQCTQSCSGTFLNECSEWLKEVEKRIPSIVVRAQDPDGVDLRQSRVSIDDVVIATSLDGKPMTLDVGTHRLKIESDGFVPIDREIVAADGETGRIVTVTMQRSKAAAPALTASQPSQKIPPPQSLPLHTEPSRPVPWPVYLTAGIAVVGAAGFGVFGVIGQGARSDLDATHCAPHCASGDVDGMSRDFLIADIALGVGVVAAIATVWLYVTRPTMNSATTATTAPTTQLAMPPPRWVHAAWIEW